MATLVLNNLVLIPFPNPKPLTYQLPPTLHSRYKAPLYPINSRKTSRSKLYPLISRIYRTSSGNFVSSLVVRIVALYWKYQSRRDWIESREDCFFVAVKLMTTDYCSCYQGDGYRYQGQSYNGQAQGAAAGGVFVLFIPKHIFYFYSCSYQSSYTKFCSYLYAYLCYQPILSLCTMGGSEQNQQSGSVLLILFLFFMDSSSIQCNYYSLQLLFTIFYDYFLLFCFNLWVIAIVAGIRCIFYLDRSGFIRLGCHKGYRSSSINSQQSNF